MGSTTSEVTKTEIQDAIWATCSNGMVYVGTGSYKGFAITGTYNVTIQAHNGAKPVIDGEGYGFATGRTAAVYIAEKAWGTTVRGITVTERSGEDQRSGFVVQDVTNTTLVFNNINVSSNVECVSSTSANTASLLLIRDTTGTYNVRKNWWGNSNGPAWSPVTLTYATYKDKPYLAAAYSGTITKTVNSSNETIPGVINAITLTSGTSAVLASFNEAPKTVSGITPTRYFDVVDVVQGSSPSIDITVCGGSNEVVYYDVTATSWNLVRPITITGNCARITLSNTSQPSLSQLAAGVTGTFFAAGLSSGSTTSSTTSSSSTTTTAPSTTTTSLPPATTTTSAPPSSGGAGEITVPVLQTTGFVGFSFPIGDTSYPIQTQTFSISNTGSGTLEWDVGEPVYRGASGWITAITPRAGSGNRIVSVTVNRTLLPQTPGRYEATIPVTSNGGSDNVLIRITLQESGQQPPSEGAAQLQVSPTFVTFGPQISEQEITAKNTGTASGSWNIAVHYDVKAADWLTVNPISFTIAPSEQESIALLVNRTGLSENTYTATLDFMPGSETSPAATVLVNMEVSSVSQEGTPVLAVDKNFYSVGLRENSFSITVRNSGTGTLLWSIGDIEYKGRGSGWLSFEPSSGSVAAGEEATVTATVDRNAVPRFGLYRATVPITSNGGSKKITIVMWNPLFRR